MRWGTLVLGLLVGGLTVILSASFSLVALAQNGASAKTAAPIDLTGYWVAIITPDWRERMIPPARGDYLSVPINLAAKQVADAWDPSKDEASGQQCKSYGAPTIMSTPTRLHVSWQDDNTLMVDTDYGMQQRVFRFVSGPASTAAASWQGTSVAQWELMRPSVSGSPGAGVGGRGGAVRFGSLKVTTTRVRPGYLRKNGVPYSANVRVDEYWDVFTDPTGTQRLMVTQTIDDREYLARPWIVAYNFKKERDASKWDPTACSSRW